MGSTPGLAPDYAAARARFLRAAERAGGELTSRVHPQPGRDGEEVAIDVAIFGPPDATDGMLVVSGTHGVEGFCGSALQSRLLESGVDRGSGPRRLVMVHALNPIGFSWVRRVNEDNIDLNRNFIDWSVAPPTNEGYASMADLLVPAEWTVEEQERTTGLLLEHAISIGMEQMQADVSRGQYQHPTGVFYGGTEAAWSNRMLNAIVGELADLERLTVIDLHTGLGDWGAGELITSYRPEDAGYRRAERLWGTVTSMYDGSSTSALLTGDWLDAIESWIPQVEVTAAALEFGTVDTVSVLQALRADAWLHAHGNPGGPEAAEVRAQVRAAFADDDPAWLEPVEARFIEVFSQAT